VRKRWVAPAAFTASLVTILAGCTNPYDPAQRAVGGGLLGAVTGAATTPAPPPLPRPAYYH
jgi:hypothetical protein